MVRLAVAYWPTTVLALGVSLFFVDTSHAQRRSFRWLSGTSKADLATLPDVQAELKLSDEQKTRIAEIHDRLRDDLRAMFGTGFGEFREIYRRSERLNAEFAQKIDDLLDDKQRKRLLEISIQQNGPRSLNDPAVVSTLELTAEQVSQLAAARDANRGDFESVFAQYGREWRRQVPNMVEKFDERLLGVLTPEQRDRLEAMKGAPIEIDTIPLRGWRR